MRISEVKRKTGETDIEVKVNLDGEGNYNISTGIGFFDHMLNLFTRHGLMDIDLKAVGDLEVDGHHTVEDVGIALGNAIKNALGNKERIKRYGTSYVPMDEALAFVSLDLSGRPFLVFDYEMEKRVLGTFDTELVEEFFRALAFNAGITLHIRVLYGKNLHHIIEGIFKATGKALREAVTVDERIKGVMSTKGVLE